MYRALVTAFALAAIAAPSVSSAQIIENGIPAFNCVKKTYVGNATTYDPTVGGGWKTGGMGLSTGGQYNPEGWAAALQLDLATQVGCGAGSGNACRAIVSSPKTGRAAIVLINDNGPMCADRATYLQAKDCQQKGRYARVIDFNRDTMRFFSNGSSGSNVGFIEDVQVAILDPKCNMVGSLGPLTGTDKDAWSKVAASVPPTHLPYASPSGSLDTPYGPMTPMYGSPFGTNPFSPVSINPYSAQGASPAGFGGVGGVASSLGTASSPFGVVSGNAGSVGSDGGAGMNAAVSILVQPKNIKPGQNIVVSWTSVGMKPSSCKVTKNDAEFATGNEAAKRDIVTGSVKYTVECTTLFNNAVEASDSLNL